MFELFSPGYQVDSIDSIKIEMLKQEGIRGLMIDLDNTMTPWNDVEVGPKVADWFKRLREAGIRACILSNNKKRQRVAIVAEKLGIPFVFRASKPRQRAFQAGMGILGTGLKDTAVIGDQLFTDILGGNRMRLLTILVLPISEREWIGTRFMRQLERGLVWVMKRFARYQLHDSKVR